MRHGDAKSMLGVKSWSSPLFLIDIIQREKAIIEN